VPPCERGGEHQERIVEAIRKPGLALLQSRTTLCWLRGPMTRHDLRRLTRPAG
jgi:hypothetical protein